jgi:hypothetical protein
LIFTLIFSRESLKFSKVFSKTKYNNVTFKKSIQISCQRRVVPASSIQNTIQKIVSNHWLKQAKLSAENPTAQLTRFTYAQGHIASVNTRRQAALASRKCCRLQGKAERSHEEQDQVALELL